MHISGEYVPDECVFHGAELAVLRKAAQFIVELLESFLLLLFSGEELVPVKRQISHSLKCPIAGLNEFLVCASILVDVWVPVGEGLSTNSAQ